MPTKKPLRDYARKRDFRKTPEPAGGQSARRREAPLFVVQKHQASSLHYDLRLEAAGVLKSWAVPKGPSTDPREKRLAMPTEDHPLEYAEFEGVIPEEEYGGGTVLVWDTGTYRNLTEKDGRQIEVEEAVERGHVKFWLEGEKLTGGYALTKTGDDRWILVKLRDEKADARRNPVQSQQRSVQTDRTLEEVAQK